MATETQSLSIESLAKEADACFESARRDDSDESYIRVRTGSPDWLSDLVQSAHETLAGLMFPDDWRYACIASAVEAIADGADENDGAHDFADGYVDVYTSDRHAWLSSHSSRSSYVDLARSDGLIDPSTDLDDQLGVGQYVEAQEVFVLVWRFLADRLDELESEADDQDGGYALRSDSL